MTGGQPKVAVVGLWHLGCVTAACLAEFGHEVVGVDSNPTTVAGLSQGEPPLFEPGLAELVAKHLATGRLSFTSDLGRAVAGAGYVWIAFDTPVDDHDEADLSGINATVDELAPHLDPGAVVLVSSQVPVGTCERIGATIRRTTPTLDVGIAYIPENLRLGHAISRFQRPAMIVIGADRPATEERVRALLDPIDALKLGVNLRTAEMTKHAINAFLATSISFANELGNVCDAVGADAVAVARALRLDERIGPKARVDPGLGFAGGTLARDLRTLQHVGERHDVETTLVDAVLEVNRRQNGWVVRKLRQIFGDLEGKTFAVLGLTYTVNTSTLRRSAAIEIIRDLAGDGATVKAFDPKADRDEVERAVSRQPSAVSGPHPLAPSPPAGGEGEDAPPARFEFVEDPYRAAAGADALVIVTDWPEFKALDYGQVHGAMRRPLLLDTKNMLDEAALRGLGFEYVGIGRGHQTSGQ